MKETTLSKTVLITGASSGVGRDTARTLARAGYRVFASMRDLEKRNRERAEALRREGIEERPVTALKRT